MPDCDPTPADGAAKRANLRFVFAEKLTERHCHKKPRKKFAEDGRLKAYGSGGRKPPTISATPVYSVPALIYILHTRTVPPSICPFSLGQHSAWARGLG